MLIPAGVYRYGSSVCGSRAATDWDGVNGSGSATMSKTRPKSVSRIGPSHDAMVSVAAASGTAVTIANPRRQTASSNS